MSWKCLVSFSLVSIQTSCPGSVWSASLWCQYKPHVLEVFCQLFSGVNTGHIGDGELLHVREMSVRYFLDNVEGNISHCHQKCKWNNRIYHYTPEGTRESHLSVHDLQSTTRFAELWMSQIMDTRMNSLVPTRVC